MIPEEPKLLTQISLINKEISIKYSNLINNYNEVIVQPFNQFTTNYEKFYSEYNIEFGNISNNLITLKNKTNKALYDYKESSKLLQKMKKEGNDNMENNEMQRILIENKNNEEKYKYALNQENKLIEIFNKNYFDINHKFIEYEESLIAFIKDTINKTIQYIKEKVEIENEFMEKLKNINDMLDAKKQTEKLKLEFNKYKKFGERFQKEDFKNSFGLAQRNLNLDLDYLNKLKERTINSEIPDKNPKNKKKNEIISFIKDFIEKLFSSEEIDIESIKLI